MLAGRGDLTFTSIPPREAGVVMPGDAMGCVVLDLDGDGPPDFACSTNDGPVRAFSSRRPGRSLAVRIAGPPGNPTGVGTRVTLLAPDGTRAVRVITAGTGYLSQSAPTAWFSRVEPGSRLEVRWPDGDTTEHAVAAGDGVQVVLR